MIFGFSFHSSAQAKNRWLSACINLLLPAPQNDLSDSDFTDDFTDDKIIRSMQSFPILSIRDLEEGSTKPQLIIFDNGLRGIFKKCLGTGANCAAEIAAYKLSRYLGLNLVPETTMLTFDSDNGKSITGSIQRWVPFPDGFSNPERQLKIDPAYIIKEKIFDFLTSTFDRNRGNHLITSKGRLILVDHGFSFKNSALFSFFFLFDRDIQYLNSGEGKTLYQKIGALKSSDISQILPELSADQLKDLTFQIDKLIEHFER